MPSIEYRQVLVRRPTGFSLRFQPPDIEGILTAEARHGWRLAEALPLWPYGWFSSSAMILLILQRELKE